MRKSRCSQWRLMPGQIRPSAILDFGDYGVLHGMKLIQRAAGCVLGGSEALSPRDQLLAGYWNLLQSTRRIDLWPSELREDFLEIQAAFFQDGLPPETVSRMTEREADAAVEMILRFRDKAWAYARGMAPASISLESVGAAAAEVPRFEESFSEVCVAG